MPLPTVVKWNQPCIRQKCLQDIKADEFRRFNYDRGLLTANDMEIDIGHFVKVLDLRHCLYVYEYPQRIMFSKV